MFLEEADICNYADNTTIDVRGPNIENVFMHLENDALEITEWFPNNFMKLNDANRRLMSLVQKEVMKYQLE